MSKLDTSQKLQTATTFTNAPSGVLQRKCASCGNHTIAGEKCDECENKNNVLQRKSSGGLENLEAPPIVHEVLRSSGQPLDKSTRAFFEPRFAQNFSGVSVNSTSRQMSHSSLTIGEPTDIYEQEADRVADSIMLKEKHENKTLSTNKQQNEKFDLSHVQIHTDAQAVESANAVNALAYTIGNNIVFGAGQFAPNTYKGLRLIAHELTHTIQQNDRASNLSAGAGPMQFYKAGHRLQRLNNGRTNVSPASPAINTLITSPPVTKKIGFVRAEGLNLREKPDQHSTSLATLKFGLRVHVLENSSSHPSWLKVAVLGKTGYVFEPQINFPPEDVIQKDPGLRMIKVKEKQTFWGLVKDVYGIQGNEGTKDQNINHFINAIRAVNTSEAFTIKTDVLDDIGNAAIPGRDASDTFLKEGYDLWIPSFGVAFNMDVGSGTVRGEVTRFSKKILQKYEDFKTACNLSAQFMLGAIKNRVGEMAEGLIEGLLNFAKDAAKILATSTLVGAVIGALFGGVTAIPGAEIGFEVGLIILEYYGLYILIEAILGVAGGLLFALGQFIKLVWTANGDRDKLTEAAKSLADAIGIMVTAILIVLIAYLLKKGGDFIKKTKFAEKVGKTRLAKWLEDRQNQTTSKRVKEQKPVAHKSPAATAKPPKADDLLDEVQPKSEAIPETPVTGESAKPSPNLPLSPKEIKTAVSGLGKLKNMQKLLTRMERANLTFNDLGIKSEAELLELVGKDPEAAISALNERIEVKGVIAQQTGVASNKEKIDFEGTEKSGGSGGASSSAIGDEGVAQSIEKAHKQGEIVLGEQIHVLVEVTPGYFKEVIPDLLVQTKDGALKFIDAKKGMGAKLTENQKLGYPIIRAKGCVPFGPNAKKALSGVGWKPGTLLSKMAVQIDQWLSL